MSLARLYERFLLRQGFDAISFTDPQKALAPFKQYHSQYSLVITDLRMPGMSGIDLSNKIRQIDADVKIILITAFDTYELYQDIEYRKTNIAKILEKPFRLRVLQKEIEEILCDTKV